MAAVTVGRATKAVKSGGVSWKGVSKWTCACGDGVRRPAASDGGDDDAYVSGAAQYYKDWAKLAAGRCLLVPLSR